MQLLPGSRGVHAVQLPVVGGGGQGEEGGGGAQAGRARLRFLPTGRGSHTLEI